MSYDLGVFDIASAPKDKIAFDTWWTKALEAEQEFYDDIAITTPELAAWFHNMRKSYPPMNGPFAPAEDSANFDSPKITGYQIGPKTIYCDFRWSEAEDVGFHMFELAEEHGLAVYDPQRDVIIYPREKTVVKNPSFWAKLKSLIGG